MSVRPRSIALAVSSALLFATATHAQYSSPTLLGMTAFGSPAALEPNPAAIASQLQAPSGFVVSVWAEHLGTVGTLSAGKDGTIYATRPDSSDVVAFAVDASGQAGPMRRVASNRTGQAQAAPNEMVFYNGSAFPAEYKGNAFVAVRGFWNRESTSGYKVVRIRFDNGKPARTEDFVTGFMSANGEQYPIQLTGIAVSRDGSLLIADGANGVIFRVAAVNGGQLATGQAGGASDGRVGQPMEEATSTGSWPRPGTALLAAGAFAVGNMSGLNGMMSFGVHSFSLSPARSLRGASIDNLRASTLAMGGSKGASNNNTPNGASVQSNGWDGSENTYFVPEQANDFYGNTSPGLAPVFALDGAPFMPGGNDVPASPPPFSPDCCFWDNLGGQHVGGPNGGGPNSHGVNAGGLNVAALDAPGALLEAAVVTPEPGSILLCASGLVGVAVMAWRRKRGA